MSTGLSTSGASPSHGHSSPHRRAPRFSVLALSAGARLGAASLAVAGLWLVVAWALDWFS